MKNIGNTEQITTIIMHELKSPLALISANIDYLELCDEEKKFAKNYTVVKKEIAKAGRIIDDFISALGSSDSSMGNSGICEVISEIAENYMTTYENEIAFTFDFKAGKELEVTAVDKMAYAIVFGNIIKNAVEAIKAAGRERNGIIRISSEIEEGNLLFKITDNGIGIGESELDLLDRNEQFTTKEQGSGVGINICKKIMGDLGGSYTISNNVDSGCVVEIKLPKDICKL